MALCYIEATQYLDRTARSDRCLTDMVSVTYINETWQGPSRLQNQTARESKDIGDTCTGVRAHVAEPEGRVEEGYKASR